MLSEILCSSRTASQAVWDLRLFQPESDSTCLLIIFVAQYRTDIGTITLKWFFWNEVFLGPHSRHHLFTRAICHKNQMQARKGNKFYTQNPHAARRLFCNVALGRDESGKINFLLFHGRDRVWQEDLPGDESPWADIDGLVPFPFFRPIFVLSRKISFFPRYSFFDFGTFAPPYIYIFFMSLSNLAKLPKFIKIAKNLKSPNQLFGFLAPPFINFKIHFPPFSSLQIFTIFSLTTSTHPSPVYPLHAPPNPIFIPSISLYPSPLPKFLI